MSNSFVAFLLFFSFLLPYVSPKSFPALSLLSLLVSPLILLNLLFVVYWLIRLKKYFFISLVPLLIAYVFFNPFIQNDKFDIKEEAYSYQIKILSYNVRLFNAFEKEGSKINETTFLQDIIKEEQPDIISIQEYYKNHTVNFSDYPYRFIYFKSKKTRVGKKENYLGHAIFSKYPLISQSSFDFEGTANNTLHTQLVIDKDTLSLYNAHLQSLGITASVSQLQEADATILTNRMSTSFIKQQKQAEIIKEHQKTSSHPVIITGDFNNTAYSYTYHAMLDGLQDTFIEKGNGLGTTFSFDGYPMRIDYIMADPSFDVLNFKTFTTSFSDHYPIMTTLGFPAVITE